MNTQTKTVVGIRVDAALIQQLKKDHPEWKSLDTTAIVDIVLRSYLETDKR
jgi:uncharacterized protein (DUF4415 family)